MSFVQEWAGSIREMPAIYHYAFVFIISMIPIIEQRGSIPLGIALFGMNPFMAFLVSFLGSLIPCPIILLCFNAVYNWMRKYNLFKGFCDFLDRKVRKNSPKIEKYKEIGLITFVGIPLPTTGVWTGSLIAAVLGLRFGKSVYCVTLGALISAIVITVLVATAGWLL